MGWFDFLKSRKKKNESAPKSETELVGLDNADLSGIEPPETRFTEEYREFLEEQDAAGSRTDPSEEEPADTET